MSEEKVFQENPDQSDDKIEDTQNQSEEETEILTDEIQEDEIEATEFETQEVKASPEEEQAFKIEELEDKILRLQAEIANMTRTQTREKQDLIKFRSQALASQLLEVIDNLERALETEISSEDGESLKKGVEMVHKQFLTAFEANNIHVVNPLNEEFDPNFHQAISTSPVTEEHPDNTVVQVLQKGYRIDTRVIRPAMVIVAQSN